MLQIFYLLVQVSILLLIRYFPNQTGFPDRTNPEPALKAELIRSFFLTELLDFFVGFFFAYSSKGLLAQRFIIFEFILILSFNPLTDLLIRDAWRRLSNQ
jgi:hypothetical protein